MKENIQFAKELSELIEEIKKAFYQANYLEQKAFHDDSIQSLYENFNDLRLKFGKPNYQEIAEFENEISVAKAKIELLKDRAVNLRKEAERMISIAEKQYGVNVFSVTVM